jgi:hypothetical protein
MDWLFTWVTGLLPTFDTNSEWVALILAIMKVLEIIARMTPTDTDNKVVDFLRKACAVFGLAVKDNPGASAAATPVTPAGASAGGGLLSAITNIFKR